MKKLVYLFIAAMLIIMPISLFAQEGSSMTQTTTSTSDETASEAPVQPTGVEENQASQPVYSMYETDKMVYLPLNSQFAITGEDEIAGIAYIEYSINEKGFVKYTEPITFAQEGYYTIIYRAYDNVGNVAFSKTITLCVDDSSPVMQLIPTSTVYQYKGLNFIPANYSFYLRAYDQYAGVKSLYYSVNEGEFMPYESPIKFDQQGAYVIKYYSVDNVGNISNIYTYQFVVDTIAPTVKIKKTGLSYEKDEMTIINSQTKFSVQAFDKDSGLKIILVSIDGGEFLPYSGEFSFTEEGEHTIAVQAIDYVNNTSEMIEIKVYVDNTPPTSSYNVTVVNQEEEVQPADTTEDQAATTDEGSSDGTATDENNG